MNNRRTKIADRGVSEKPIALRLPRDIREKAEELAAREGVSLNRHATAAYLRGIRDTNGEQA